MDRILCKRNWYVYDDVNEAALIFMEGELYNCRYHYRLDTYEVFDNQGKQRIFYGVCNVCSDFGHFFYTIEDTLPILRKIKIDNILNEE